MTKILLFTLCCLTTAGCVNSPRAIHMNLVPEKKAFAVGEPVYVNATLTAVDGPVCLGKASRFEVELRHPDWAEPRTSPPVAYCGTGFAISLPLYPVLASVALLDVADLMDRYWVLSTGRQRTERFEVLPRQSLPSGRYHLRATLVSTIDPRHIMNWYPAPLFWKVYDQPIIAETQFVIADAGTE